LSRLARCCWMLLISSLLAGLAMSAAGCQAAGALAYVVAGDAPVEPEYKLPRVETLVFVENYTNADVTEDDADVLSRYIVDNLKKNLNNKKKEDKKQEIPMVFVDPLGLYDLRTADAEKFHQMKIQEIGRQLGAKQVLYVTLDSIGVQSTGGSEMMRGMGSARVKVINCATGQTQWPEESTGGFPVNFESKLITPQQEITYEQARDGTMRTMALSISRLFYKYNPSDDDETDTFAPASDE
jgi:hypothetical protein